ncbi:zinc finger CCCH domain-containing 22-like [Olea europaea subsp. europaea]|uniref:Zinc finger CCCH domain-containing 22-like n=1 Tax=Olea europaea subsp. europaea TaxID=158383 RepID=A0A8S0TJW7_OLEEU|nr:zinc finger CCCH domain-containing 22-like [Olea europaea subsp. europaea]
MDTYEATKIVMSRIQSMDPENASKIMGYILIQEQGEKEILRLAFGPEALLLSCINQAKACLGLPSNSPSSNPSTPLSDPMRPNNPFPQNKPRILIPNYGFHTSNPSSSAAGFSRSSPRPISYAAVVNGSIGSNDNENSGSGPSSLPFYDGNDFADESGGGMHNQVQEFPFIDDSVVDPIISPSVRSDSLVFPFGEDVNGIPSPHSHPFHRRSCSVNDAALLSGFDDGNGRGGWRPCMYFARGFCKNDNRCKFLHGGFCSEGIEMGSPSKTDSGPFDEFLRMKALQQQHRFALSPHGSHHPLAYMKCPNFLNEHQRSATAALFMGDELHKFGRGRPERNDFSAMGFVGSSNSSARQIYLTFPADSTFKEEDVSNYFSMYGPVQDVRIPYQQKRMFGFVTFLYPETVKLILAKGNPHFVCDSRVLVKPYKEKGKVLEKKQQQQIERGEFSACLSPSGLDSQEQFDAPFGSRMFYNAQEMMLQRKMEQEAEVQHAIDLQGRRVMNMQLMDLKNQHHNNHFLPNLSASAPIGSPIQSQLQMNQNLILQSHATDLEVSEEISGIQEAAKFPALVAKAEEEATKFGNNSENANKEDRTNAEDADLLESLEHILPDNLFASPTKLAAEQQSFFAHASTDTDEGIPVIASSTNSPLLPNSSALDMASLKSYYFQMPSH